MKMRTRKSNRRNPLPKTVWMTAIVCLMAIIQTSAADFDARKHGAKGDGKSKDTAALQSAIEQISSDCGWPSANSLKNLFKRRFGMSMRAYRNQNRAP